MPKSKNLEKFAEKEAEIKKLEEDTLAELHRQKHELEVKIAKARTERLLILGELVDTLYPDTNVVEIAKMFDASWSPYDVPTVPGKPGRKKRKQVEELMDEDTNVSEDYAVPVQERTMV